MRPQIDGSNKAGSLPAGMLMFFMHHEPMYLPDVRYVRSSVHMLNRELAKQGGAVVV